VKARAAPTNNSEAHLQYLRALEWRRGTGGSYEESIAALKRAVQLDPSFADAWEALGATYVSGFASVGYGTYESVRREAVDDLQRALALNPQLAAAHSDLAEIYYQMDWTSAPARAELERALAIDPKDSLAIWLKGYMANADGRFDEAIAMHNESRDLDPLQVDNYRQLGNAYYRAGRLDAGIAVLSDAVKRFPAAPTIHYRLACCCLPNTRPMRRWQSFHSSSSRIFTSWVSPWRSISSGAARGGQDSGASVDPRQRRQWRGLPARNRVRQSWR